MKTLWAALLLAAGLLIACQNTSAFSQASGQGLTAGLEGYIYKGPVTPVCTESVSCTAPFKGSFTVWQDGRAVAQFQTDEKGYFRVVLEPGVYSITVTNPAQTALLRPDEKIISVNAEGMTKITLSFDTGIR